MFYRNLTFVIVYKRSIIHNVFWLPKKWARIVSSLDCMHYFNFSDLPDYSKITFPDTDPLPLAHILAVGDCSPEAVSLFQGFVRYDSSKRLRAEEALNHPYFESEEPSPAGPESMPIPKPKTAANSNGLDYRVDLTMQELLIDLSHLI